MKPKEKSEKNKKIKVSLSKLSLAGIIKTKEWHYFMYSGSLLFSLLALSSVIWYGSTQASAEAQLEVPEVSPSVIETLETYRVSVQEDNPYYGLNLRAESSLVFDMHDRKIRYASNPDEILPLASVTKLMTAFVALRSVPADQPIEATSVALETYGNSGFLLGSTWDRDDLIAGTLVASSNDGAAMLAHAHPQGRTGFINEMNEVAREIGATSLTFYNETGLDLNGETVPGATGSARDVARLLAYASDEYPEILAHSSSSRVTISPLNGGKSLTFSNTNRLTGELPGVLTSKTGYTLLAGGNLTMFVNYGLSHKVIIIVLGSTREGRIFDMRKLYYAVEDDIVNSL